MNKLTREVVFQGPPAPAEQPQKPPVQRPADRAAQARPTPPAIDMTRLVAELRGGDNPLATRADLIEMHKRITTMFATLNQGLGEMYTAKAEADRTVLSARLDEVEEAVNRMEGALRIEFEPVLKSAIAEVMAQHKPKPRRLRGLLAMLVVAGLGLGLGMVYHAPLQESAASLAAQMGVTLPAF